MAMWAREVGPTAADYDRSVAGGGGGSEASSGGGRILYSPFWQGRVGKWIINNVLGWQIDGLQHGIFRMGLGVSWDNNEYNLTSIRTQDQMLGSQGQDWNIIRENKDTRDVLEGLRGTNGISNGKKYYWVSDYPLVDGGGYSRGAYAGQKPVTLQRRYRSTRNTGNTLRTTDLNSILGVVRDPNLVGAPPEIQIYYYSPAREQDAFDIRDQILNNRLNYINNIYFCRKH